MTDVDPWEQDHYVPTGASRWQPCTDDECDCLIGELKKAPEGRSQPGPVIAQ